MQIRAIGVMLGMGGVLLLGCGAHPGDEVDESAEDLSGTVTLTEIASGKCADVSGASLTNGTNVIQWSCSGHTNQQWALKSVATNTFNLVNVNSGKCMDVSGGSTSAGAKVIQWSCNGGNNQKWIATSAGSGRFQFKAVHSGQCLDVTGNSLVNGTLYEQWPCKTLGTGNQTFQATNVTSGGGTTGPTASQLLSKISTCSKVVSGHAYAKDEGGTKNINICGLNGAVFWKADMDIDCDGRAAGGCPGDDPSYLPDTAFHNLNDQPLAADITPYTVIPNDFHISGLDTSNGGNVIAVIFNGLVQYTVFGDTGPTDIIGEASRATARALGIPSDPNSGGVDSGVAYITFIGSGTRPSNIEDQTATKNLGIKLATAFLNNN